MSTSYAWTGSFSRLTNGDFSRGLAGWEGRNLLHLSLRSSAGNPPPEKPSYAVNMTPPGGESAVLWQDLAYRDLGVRGADRVHVTSLIPYSPTSYMISAAVDTEGVISVNGYRNGTLRACYVLDDTSLLTDVQPEDSIFDLPAVSEMLLDRVGAISFKLTPMDMDTQAAGTPFTAVLATYVGEVTVNGYTGYKWTFTTEGVVTTGLAYGGVPQVLSPERNAVAFVSDLLQESGGAYRMGRTHLGTGTSLPYSGVAPEASAYFTEVRPDRAAAILAYATSAEFGDATRDDTAAIKIRIYGSPTTLRPGGTTSGPVPGDLFCSGDTAAVVTAITVESGYTVLTCGQSTLGNAPEAPVRGGTFKSWSLIKGITGYLVSSLPAVEYELQVAFRLVGSAPGSLTARIVFLNDYGLPVGHIDGTALEALDGIQYRSVFRFTSACPFPGRPRFVLSTSQAATFGEFTLVRGRLADGDYEADPLFAGRVAQDAAVIEPGVVTLYAGGAVCPSGWRPVVQDTESEGNGLLMMNRSSRATEVREYDPVVTLIEFNGVSPTHGANLITGSLVAKSPVTGFENRLIRINAGMALVAIPIEAYKLTKPIRSWPIYDAAGRVEGDNTFVGLHLLGDVKAELDAAIAESRSWFIVRGAYLRVADGDAGGSTRGSSAHSHVLGAIDSFSVGLKLSRVVDSDHPVDPKDVLVSRLHAHPNAGYSTPPLPLGRAVLLCQKL